MGIILICLATRIHLILKNRWQKYLKRCQTNKKVCKMFNRIRY